MMKHPLRIAHAARRRRMARGALRVGGPWLLHASLAAGALVLMDRAFNSPAPDGLLIALPFAGALARIALAMRAARADDESSAAEVDRALGLKDRLACAVALARRREDDPFAALAIADGERVARQTRVSRALPLSAGWTWWAWPIALAGAVAGAVFIPSARAGAQRAAQEERRAAGALVSETTERIRDAAGDAREALAQVDDDRVHRDLEALDEIARQLEQGGDTPEGARARAAESLHSAADALQEQADQRDRAFEDVQDRLRRLDAAEETSPAGDLRDALREGDLEAARRAAEELEERLTEADTAQREEIARDLESLADQIDRIAPPGDAPDEPADGAPPSEIPRKAPGAQEDEQTPEPAQPPKSAKDEVREQTERLRDAIRDAAEQARKPPQSPHSPREEQQRPIEGEPPPDERRQDRPEQREGQPQGGQPKEQTEGHAQEGQQGQGREHEQPAGEQGEAKEEGSRGQEQPQSGGQQGERRDPRSQPQSQPGAHPQGAEEQQEQQGAGESPQPSQGETPDAPAEQDLRRLRETLERLQDERRSAEDRRRDSEQLREQADRMLENMTPGERERMERFARQLAEEMGEQPGADGAGDADAPRALGDAPQPPPFRTEDVDARGESPEDAGRVISRWFNDDGEPREGRRAIPPEAQQRLTEAADAAERAVEDQGVPNRYRDAVRRYFDLLRRLGEGDSPPPPAEDVPKPSGGT